MGMAASMGAFLLASGTKGKRFAPVSYTHLINELFPAAYEAAVKEAGIEPVGRPEVSVDAASETEGVTLTVKVLSLIHISGPHCPAERL